jgi:hypothetical protein
MAHQGVLEGALALLQTRVDHQAEHRPDEQDGDEEERDHGDDPSEASRADP